MAEKLLLGITDAAERLSVHPDTIRRMAARGEITTVRLARRVLIPLVEVHRLAGKKSQSVAVPR